MKTITTPQLKKVHQGKVRELFEINKKQLLLVATDRVSAFDRPLENTVPQKGEILSRLSAFWFEKCGGIIPNHFSDLLAPNAMLIHAAKPILLEIIVRGYLTGSIWRRYQKGERIFSGVTLPDRMKELDRFPTPIITPTTKEKIDHPITPEVIIQEEIVEECTYKTIEETSLQLFDLGSKYCESKGILLIDTKYEFGWLDNELCLIDEIHTPDSSRFLKIGEEKKKHWHDKEYIRQWLLSQEMDPENIATLPPEVVQEAQNRYRWLFETLTGKSLSAISHPKTDLYHALVDNKLIDPAYIAIVVASPKDLEHAEKIKKEIAPYGIKVDMRMMSAHKNGEAAIDLANEYNYSIEPGACIAIAGRSNGLGGALAANLNIPVISCPPIKDYADLAINIHSSLVMPSETPGGTCIDPKNCALLALRSLNLHSLREKFIQNIANTKQKLRAGDEALLKEHRKPQNKKVPIQ